MDPQLRARHPDLETVVIDGKDFVSGLYWKPLRSARAYMEEAKAIGKAEGMEMVTIRKSRTVIQAGFAPKGRAKLKGKYSLAAALAGELGDNWIGAFDLDGGRYAFVAVYQGAIVPGKDIIGPRETILTALQETYSLLSGDAPNFKTDGRVIAPVDFQYGGEAIDLVALFQGKKLPKAYRLRPLTLGLTPKEIGLGVVVAVLLGAGALFGTSWYEQRQHAQAQAAAAAQAAQAETADEYARATAAAGIVRPWAAVPAPATLIEACAAALVDTPIAVTGWTFSAAVCQPQGTTLTYIASPTATRSEFLRAAQAAFNQLPQWSADGRSATLRLAASLTPSDGDELPEADVGRMRLADHVRRVGHVAQLTLAIAPASDPHVASDTPRPDWRTTRFTVQSRLPPGALFLGYESSGTRIHQITTQLNANAATLDWTITGELYGR